MDEISLIQCDTLFARFLISLDRRHPNPQGSVLIYGTHTDTESYVRIAVGLGFTVHASETRAAFVELIQSDPDVQLIVMVSDRIEKETRDALISACASLSPLYALHIYTKCGTRPGTNHRYRLTILDDSLVAGNPSGDRVARATRDLFGQANVEDFTDKSVPDWIEQELSRQDRS